MSVSALSAPALRPIQSIAGSAEAREAQGAPDNDGDGDDMGAPPIRGSAPAPGTGTLIDKMA